MSRFIFAVYEFILKSYISSSEEKCITLPGPAFESNRSIETTLLYQVQIHLVVLFCYKYIAVVTILAPNSQEKEKMSYNMSGLYFYEDRAFFRAEGVYLRNTIIQEQESS